MEARLMLFVGLLLVFTVSFSFGQTCSGTSCADCIASSTHSLQCGYCYDTVGGYSFCANGTASGPYDTYCSANDLIWYFDYCGDPCTNQGICVDCALDFPGCGWCVTTNSCFSSSRASSCPGPASNFRNSTTDPNACVVSAPCTQQYSCSNCLSNTAQDCIWCAANYTGYCVPASGGPGCGNSQVLANVDSCPNFAAPAVASSYSSFLLDFLRFAHVWSSLLKIFVL